MKKCGPLRVGCDMRMALRVLILAALACSARGGVSEEAVPTPPSVKQLEAWARDLGANDFQKREEAQRNLAAAGQAAAPVLEKALKSDDPEVRTRAERLLAPLTRDDRLLEAARSLGDADWAKVSSAIDVLLARSDKKSENALSRVADGTDRAAGMARVLLGEVARIRAADEKIAELIEVGKRNPAVKREVDKRKDNVKREYRRHAYESCLKEFEKLKRGGPQKEPDTR